MRKTTCNVGLKTLLKAHRFNSFQRIIFLNTKSIVVSICFYIFISEFLKKNQIIGNQKLIEELVFFRGGIGRNLKTIQNKITK